MNMKTRNAILKEILLMTAYNDFEPHFLLKQSLTTFFLNEKTGVEYALVPTLDYILGLPLSE